MSDGPRIDEQMDALVSALDEQSALLRRRIALDRDWRLQLGRGILMGFGSVLGATVVVSLIVWALRPFAHFNTVSNVVSELERRDMQQDQAQEQIRALEQKVAELEARINEASSERTP